MANKKDRIPESKLLKALAELEDVTKGDPLEDQDPEGGLSTEGEPLSGAAPRGRGEQTKKSRNRASASSPFQAASSSSSDGSSDDDDDASSPLMPPKKGKKDKGKKVSKATARTASSSSESDDGSDDGSSDSGSDDADKSFREMAEDDETMQKGLQVNDFLEAMTDQLSLALLHVKESIAKSLMEMESRLLAHIDEGLAKSTGSRRDFEVRLAKGIAEIGRTVVGDLLPMADMVKSLADQPAGSPRGKAVLSKGEVNRPPWSGSNAGEDNRTLADGSGGGDDVEALRELGAKSMCDWLFKKGALGEIDPKVPIAFEADRYDPAFLPEGVRKAMYNDLIK